MADIDVSEEQANFIRNAAPTSVLLARPGSGKTRVGVLRFLERAKPNASSGVAYLSFTNVAIEEASKRAAQLNRRDVLLAPNTVETLDGFLRTKIFDVFAEAHFKKSILNPLIVEELGGYFANVDALNGTKVFGVESFGVSARKFKPYFTGDVVGFLYERSDYSTIKVDKSLSPDILKAKREMLFGGYAPYDDIRLWSYQILENVAMRAAKIIARRFPEILVDEAQDTTSIHRQILKVLEEAGSEICYIGDPRQAIFEFGDAEGEFLEALAKSRQCWELTMNFRSSDKIVGVIRSHFNDPKMKWQRTCQHDRRGCFAIVASPEDAVRRFPTILADAEIDVSSSAVLVRTRGLRREILGEAGVTGLASTVRRILLAWRREQNNNYEMAAQDATAFLLTVLDLDEEARRDRQRWKVLAWRFLRCGLPPFGDLTFASWIDALKGAVETFAAANGLAVRPNLGHVLRKSGLPTGKISDVLSRPRVTVPIETIHSAKGKSISAVLVIGSPRHHRDWLDLQNHEMSRIGYVAFTRAENVLVLACPTEALATEWSNKGFARL